MTVRPRSEPKAEALEPAAPRSSEEALGERLRAMFDHVADQPLPDEIMHLVDELERKRLLEEPDED